MRAPPPVAVPTGSVSATLIGSWNSRSMMMATTHASSDRTSWTSPRTIPIKAPPPSKTITKISSALISGGG